MKGIGKKIDPILHGAAELIVKSDGGGNSAAKNGGSAILATQEMEVDVERKRLLSEQQARVRAARRGGYRALLSQQRLAPETGLQTTLGAG